MFCIVHALMPLCSAFLSLAYMFMLLSTLAGETETPLSMLFHGRCLHKREPVPYRQSGLDPITGKTGEGLSHKHQTTEKSLSRCKTLAQNCNLQVSHTASGCVMECAWNRRGIQMAGTEDCEEVAGGGIVCLGPQLWLSGVYPLF